MRNFDNPSETTASAVGGGSSVHGLAKVGGDAMRHHPGT